MTDARRLSAEPQPFPNMALGALSLPIEALPVFVYYNGFPSYTLARGDDVGVVFTGYNVDAPHDIQVRRAERLADKFRRHVQRSNCVAWPSAGRIWQLSLRGVRAFNDAPGMPFRGQNIVNS